MDIPQLTKYNFHQWSVCIKRMATVMDIVNLITESPTRPQPDAETQASHNKRAAQASLLITTSLSQQMLDILNETDLEADPKQLYEKLQEELTKTDLARTKKHLLNRAYEVTYEPNQTTLEYIEKHKNFRKTMIQAKFPNIRGLGIRGSGDQG